MTLAEKLLQLQREDVEGSTAATLSDRGLAARVAAAARRRGMESDEYLVLAVRWFEDNATDEDWIRLIGFAGRSPTPGTASFMHIIVRALECDEEVF